jgi:hypothetical protein
VHAAVERLQRFIRQATVNGKRPAWYLQLDIHNYFMRIDKDVLFALLAAKLEDEAALWLTGLLVSEHDGTVAYRFDRAELDRLRATLSSYLGHFRRANAYKLWQSIWQGQNWLAVYFDWDEERHRVVPRHAMPEGLTNVRQQYAWLRGRFPGDVALSRLSFMLMTYRGRASYRRRS